jgi:selenide,water dikinase
VPVLPGVRELLEQGVAPGGTHRNLNNVADSVRWHHDLTQQERILLCDAQTSGGLMIAVGQDRLPSLLSELEVASVPCAAVIGEIIEGQPSYIEVTP